ncbi:MAG: DsrE family protein [Granulosicoccus sp.]
MNAFMKLGSAAALVFILISSSVFAADDEEKLFVNLSSDNIDRAAMAIGFSTKILTQKKMPVTIFLNVEGVRIADKSIPEHVHATGKSLKKMLAAFMEAGGTVLVCPMCMRNVGGLEKMDLIDGVEVGGPEITWPALFADNTTVLSY